VEKSVNWSDITAVLSSSKIPNLISYNLFDVFEHEERVGKNKKSLAISFVFENEQQTLKDSDLEKSMKIIQEKLKEKVGAVVR
jgi:phenylalanyl-tRNA synthetase beta chain